MSKAVSTSRVRNLIIFSSIIMLLFVVIVAQQASKSYNIALDNGRKSAERLTRIVGDHVELTFLAIDLTLRRVVERQYFNGLFGGTIPHDLLSNLKLWVDENPQIAAMLIINAEGEAIVAAHKKGYQNWISYDDFDFKAAPFFYQMREASERFFWVSILSSRSGFGKDLVLVSRKLTKLDGTFGGLVMAAVDPKYFVDFFKSVGAGNKGFMSLSLTDGTLVVKAPKQNPEEEANAEALLSQLYNELHTQPTEGKIQSGIDKSTNTKVYAQKLLRNLPMQISIVLDDTDFFAKWRQSVYKDVGFLAIFLIFGSILSFFAITMARQIVRVEESEASAVLASQAKSEFLANMSHELRTPLNAVIGFSEMLNSGYFGPLNPKQKERINDINLCGSHLLQLITDILEFSKGEAGKLELNDEKISLTEIVNETLRMMNEKIRAKSIHIGVDIERDLPQIWGDKRKIRQILLNLLSNSIKFTPENGNVKVTLQLDNHSNMTLSVSDTGIGIPEEEIATALSVFGQVHREQSHEGTGLGLPLCKMFAELHGGKLAIGSTLGEGTTVRITFPKQRVILGSTEPKGFNKEKEKKNRRKAPPIDI